jgi:hypothetical protein
MKVNSARRNGALGGTDGIDIQCCRHLPSGSDLHLLGSISNAAGICRAAVICICLAAKS